MCRVWTRACQLRVSYTILCTTKIFMEKRNFSRLILCNQYFLLYYSCTVCWIMGAGGFRPESNSSKVFEMKSQLYWIVERHRKQFFFKILKNRKNDHFWPGFEPQPPIKDKEKLKKKILPPSRIEPRTFGMQKEHSTTELSSHLTIKV